MALLKIILRISVVFLELASTQVFAQWVGQPGQTISEPVTTSSQAYALPLPSSSAPGPGGFYWVSPRSGTSANIYYALGNSSVTALLPTTTPSPNSNPVSGGICFAPSAGANYIALIGTSPATVDIQQVTTCLPFASLGGGGGGSGSNNSVGAIGSGAPGFGTNLSFVNSSGNLSNITSSTPLPVIATVNASVSGFAPTPSYTLASVTATSAPFALPTGSSELIYNTGSYPVTVKLGNSTAIGTGLVYGSSDLIQPGCALGLSIGSNTYLGAVTSTGNTSTLIISGGSGLAASFCGGSSSTGGIVTVSNFPSTQAISATSLPLAANAAQETGGNLANIYTSIGAVSSNPSANTVQARLAAITTALGTPFQAGGSVGISGTLPSFTSTQTFNLGTLNGAALAANQPTNAAQGSATAGQTGALIQGAATSTAPNYANGTTNPLSLTAAGALRTDASATTQPISASALPLPSGAATQTTSAAILSALGTPFQANGNIGNTSFIANAGTNLNTSALALESGGNLAATASEIGAVSASPVANTVQARLATINTTLGTPLQQSGGSVSISGTPSVTLSGAATIIGAAASGSTASGNPVLQGGVYNSTQPTVTTGQAVSDQRSARGTELVTPGVEGFSISNTGFNALQGGVANAVGNPFYISPATGASFAVTGAFYQATQPVSGTLTSNQGAAGAAPWLTTLYQGGNALSSSNGLFTNLAQLGGTALGAATTWGTAPTGLNVLNANVNCISGCGGSGGTSSSFAAAFPTTGTAAGLEYLSAAPTLTSGNMGAFQGDINGNLKINCIVGCSSTGGTSSAFGATFPANGTAEGLQYLATAPTLTNGQMVAGQTDINGNQKINCVVGCAGGTTSNVSSNSTSLTNGSTVSYIYAFNGTSWDQLQDDGNKNLKVVQYQGANPLSVTNGGYTNILQGNAVLSATNPIFTQLTASSASIGNVGITGTPAFNLSQYNGAAVGATNPVYIAPGTGSLFAENTSQIGGNSILTGTGAAGTTGSGAARVAVSTDSPGGALANAAFNKITDGTNTAAVKAASTNPSATDPAVVVTISPNNASALATSALQSTANTALSAIQTAVAGPIPTQASTVSIGGVGVLGPLGPAIAPTAAVAVTPIPGTYSITTTPQAVEGGSYLLSAYTTGSWTGASVTVTSSYSSGQTQTISQSGGSSGPFTSNTASYCVQIGQGATVAYSGTAPTGTFTVTLAGSPGCASGGASSTVAQGTAAALSGAWPLEITDGTHGPVSVKAASTAPASTDPSLVVSLSPNSEGANLSTALFTKNTDGTNVAGVKAASTPPAYTDPALVTANLPIGISSTTNGSGSTSATPNTATTIFASSTTRKGCTIINYSSSYTIYIYFDSSGTPSATNSIPLLPGQPFQCNGNGVVIQTAIQVLSATASIGYFASQY